MTVEAEVKRIGGSVFVRLPPELVRSLGLQSEDRVLLDVRRLGGTVQDLLRLKGKYPKFPPLDRSDIWRE